MFECRYLNNDDDLEKASELLYYTDAYIYPAFLGDLKNAKSILSEAIKKNMYCFGVSQLYGAFKGDVLIAVLCVKNENKWNQQEWINLFEELDINKSKYFNMVSEKYFEPMNYEKWKEDIYILAISVEKKEQKKGIGEFLLKHFINLNSQKNINLDVLVENKAAIHLYEKLGFIERKIYDGFNVYEPYPRCIRMERRTKVAENEK